MINVITLILLTSLTQCLNGVPNEQNLTLEFVQIIWRHGDRSPIMFYPNDPYLNYWPQKPGMLTQEGMRQHYALGTYLRERYMPQFLNYHYLRNETYVLSSNVDRAIESAQSNLAALYAPKDWQVWDSNLNWQPVPIHTIPADEDHFLDVPMESCPRFEKIDLDFHNSHEYQEYNKTIWPFLEQLSKFTGAFLTLDNNSFIYDNLVCDQEHDLKLPSWATPEIMKQFEQSANFEFYNLFRTKEQQRLSGGTLFKSIRNVFKDKIENNVERKLADKMVIYSAHDTTLIALTRLLDVFNYLRPPYASALLFELYSDADKNYFVKLLYRNVTKTFDHEPFVLELPFCNLESLCPWETFVGNSSKLVLEDWNQACEISLLENLAQLHENGHVARFLILALAFILGTFGVFLSIELYCWYVKRRVIDPSKLKLDITFYSSQDILNANSA